MPKSIVEQVSMLNPDALMAEGYDFATILSAHTLERTHQYLNGRT